MKNDLIVVCGGGGFIGGHLVADLRRQGFTRIRSVDRKPQTDWYQRFPDVENLVLDLQDKGACYQAVQGAREVYNLAADMGGMGFIENNKALCMITVLINTHMCMAAKDAGVERLDREVLLHVHGHRVDDVAGSTTPARAAFTSVMPV